jgi:hypothetical protein
MATGAALTALLIAPLLSQPALAQESATNVDQIIEDAGTYYGKTVTVTGQVANVVDPLGGMIDSVAFTMVSGDQSAEAGVSPDELLVIRAPTTIFGGPDLNLATSEQVEATGAVVVFNLAEIEQTTGLNLDDQALRDWDGRPAVIAWSVTETGIGATESSPPAEEALANRIVTSPGAYYGEVVTVSGEVENVFDPLRGMLEPVAFAITAGEGRPDRGPSDSMLDDPMTSQELLVIQAPVAGLGGSTAEVAAGSQVQVTGPVVVFNLAEIEQATGLNLDDQALQHWDGQPAIIAWSVNAES